MTDVGFLRHAVIASATVLALFIVLNCSGGSGNSSNGPQVLYVRDPDASGTKPACQPCASSNECAPGLECDGQCKEPCAHGCSTLAMGCDNNNVFCLCEQKGDAGACAPCRRNTDCISGRCNGRYCDESLIQCDDDRGCAPWLSCHKRPGSLATLGACECDDGTWATEAPDAGDGGITDASDAGDAAGPEDAGSCALDDPPDFLGYTPTYDTPFANVAGEGGCVRFLATNLDPVTAGNHVEVTGAAGPIAAPILDVSPGPGTAKAVTVRVPKGATTGPMTLSHCRGRSLGMGTLTIGGLAPTIASVAPSTSPEFTTVTATGTGFTGATKVVLITSAALENNTATVTGPTSLSFVSGSGPAGTVKMIWVGHPQNGYGCAFPPVTVTMK